MTVLTSFKVADMFNQEYWRAKLSNMLGST